MQQPDPNSDPDTTHKAEPVPGSESVPPVRPDVRYEPRDVSFRIVLLVTVVSCAVGTGIFFVVRGFYSVALEPRPEGRPTAFALPEKPTSQLPPEPRLELLDRLEKTPASNVAKWEQGEERALETYGTTDEKGFVRIPLQRARQMLAGHLAARQESDRPKFKDRGLVDAGEPNSGRMFRGASQ
jgi:hypothetical protein